MSVYKNSKDLDGLNIAALENIVAQGDFVDFTVTGANTEDTATAIAAIIASLVQSGIMAAK